MRRTLLLLVVFCSPLVLMFSQCFHSSENEDVRGDQYAGSASCRQCHSEIFNSYLNGAHHLTTRPASASTIHGSFTPGSNYFAFSNKLKVVAEKRKAGLYQVSYVDGKIAEAHKFDITFGGKKAESYLYWKRNQVYQLPLSYFNALHTWTNSPGYTANEVDFGRLIGTRCFECHSSYIKELPNTTQSITQKIAFDKSSLIMGIDCERCHGPAADHVTFHTEFPEEKAPRSIAVYKSLTREQKIDMCAVCHSGNTSVMTQSTFTFTPGDNLAKFKEVTFKHQKVDSAKLDVHGNQTQMLEASKCFISSKIDCTTCHNTHVAQSGSLAMYQQKCLNCHRSVNHNFTKASPSLALAISNRCVDCHMPAKPSNSITVQTVQKEKDVPYLVRSHHIAIYPEESKKVLAYIKATMK
jgi:hypothetical protein